jgi:hypothetical protein
VFLLPSERAQDLPPAAIGLRLFSRDAAMRAGRPYAVISGPGEGPSTLPWWAWISLGGVIVGLAYLAIRRRDGRDQPTYVLVDRDMGMGSSEPLALPPSPEVRSPEAVLHPFSDDAALSAAFDRDVEMIWSGKDPWVER